MTRINCLPVSELHDKHLIAEYRELPRIFTLVTKAVQDDRINNILIPSNYLLGSGHCYFFYNKLSYLADRHIDLVCEMENRGFNPAFKNKLSDVYNDLPSELWNNWTPDSEAIKCNTERINQRLETMKK